MSALSLRSELAAAETSGLSMAAKVALMLAAFDHGIGSERCSDLARRTGLSLSCVYRIVKESVDQGLLERRGNKVLLGLKCSSSARGCDGPRAASAGPDHHGGPAPGH